MGEEMKNIFAKAQAYLSEAENTKEEMQELRHEMKAMRDELHAWRTWHQSAPGEFCLTRKRSVSPTYVPTKRSRGLPAYWTEPREEKAPLGEPSASNQQPQSPIPGIGQGVSTPFETPMSPVTVTRSGASRDPIRKGKDEDKADTGANAGTGTDDNSVITGDARSEPDKGCSLCFRRDEVRQWLGDCRAHQLCVRSVCFQRAWILEGLALTSWTKQTETLQCTVPIPKTGLAPLRFEKCPICASAISECHLTRKQLQKLASHLGVSSVDSTQTTMDPGTRTADVDCTSHDVIVNLSKRK